MHNHSTAYQPRAKLKRVFLLAGALALLLALAGGYYAYWRVVAQQLQAGIEAWAAQQRALGNEVAFEWDGISGFPFRFAATFRDPAILWHAPRGNVAWKGGALEAEMAPWNLRRIEINSAGAHEASVRWQDDASELRLSTTGFAGTIELHRSGSFRSITLALQQPDLTLPNNVALASAASTLTLEQPETPPTDFNMPLARVALELRSMALPAGTRLLTEDPVEALAVDATIKGPMPLAPLREALAGWRDAGGVVELHSFRFAQGPLGLSGNATLALDSDLQPEGAGTVTSTGLGAAIEILIRDGLIPPDRALAARTTAKALEKPGPDGKPQATVGLSLQHRTVSFGPVPLFALQPIAWP
ncbi:MAG TPA: DUF2125 domain-containing protein [Dongiaceae bacterium]|jgi:hypothetical protein|nr:DUF2125 domain-containing protein [Dongiaceae bacterium]